MKKIAIVLVVLALAVPAMATITISATQQATDSNIVVIKYATSVGDTNIPRAFALTISATNKRGQIVGPNSFDPNFRVAPGSFVLDSISGKVSSWGSVIARNDGNVMITEMGSLYATNDPCYVKDPNLFRSYGIAPLNHGTLLKFRIRDNQDCNIILGLDSLRGGVVVENTAVTTPSVAFQNLTPFHYASDTAAPTPNPMTWASAPAAVAAVGNTGAVSITMTATTATDATGPVQYLFTCTAGAGHSSSWQTSTTYVDSGLVPGTYTYTVQARDAVGTPNVGTASAPASVTLDCFPLAAAYATQRVDYLAYKSLGVGKEPICWCAYNSVTPAAGGSGFQCFGDIDGLTESSFKYRIYTNDFNVLMANWKKKISDATINPCADVDHKAESSFKYRVYTNDFNRMMYNWKKKDTMPRTCPLTDTANAPVNVP